MEINEFKTNRPVSGSIKENCAPDRHEGEVLAQPLSH